MGSFLQADLSRIAEAKRVLEQISSRSAHLDAVILSAGGLDFRPVTTSEGLNNTFVVNFLHKFVLGEGLKAQLARGHGRLVLVAADIPDKMEPDWANFEGARVYAGVPSLPRLHAACLCLIQHWAMAWKSEGVEVMAIHPGVVETNFFRAATGPWKLLKVIFDLFATTPNAVATQLSTLAFAPELKGNNGEFFPAPKDPGKHRPLQRPAATIERVVKVAQSTLPS